jgi:hypothetical protein
LVRLGLEHFACVFVPLCIAGCRSNVSLGGTTGCHPPPGLETIAANQDPAGVAVDETSVYWTIFEGPVGAIVKAPLDGGVITTLATVTEENFGGVLVDATSIYWSNDQGATGLTDRITKADKTDGGNPIVMASPGFVAGMAIDSTSLYWGTEGGALMRVDKAGGSPVTLASEQAWVYNPAVDSTNVYYGTGPFPTINGVSQGPSGAVVSVPLAGGTSRTLASGQDFSVDYIAVQGSYVYYATAPYPPGSSRPGSLMRVPIGGGAPTTLASESDRIDALAVDSANLYWGGHAIGLKSMPLAGGAATEPAPCQLPVGIAVSNTSLYWVNSHGANASNGSVMRLTPK